MEEPLVKQMFWFACFPCFVIKSLWQTDESAAAQKHSEPWLQSINCFKEIWGMGDTNVISWKCIYYDHASEDLESKASNKLIELSQAWLSGIEHSRVTT